MSAAQEHHYYVHLSDGPRGEGKVITDADSPEAAALDYVEHAPVDGTDQISVLVRDCNSGRQHCFLIDLDSGAVGPCN